MITNSLNAWFSKTEPDANGFRPAIFCKDGFAFLVNAGSKFMSFPGVDRLSSGGKPSYCQVEVFIPHEPADYDAVLLAQYERQSETIGHTYGFVPTDVVRMIIKNHGGFETSQESSSVQVSPERFYLNTKTGEVTESKCIAKVWLYIDMVPVEIHNRVGRLVTLNPLGI